MPSERGDLSIGQHPLGSWNGHDWYIYHIDPINVFISTIVISYSIGFSRLVIQLVSFCLGLEYIHLWDDNVKHCYELEFTKGEVNFYLGQSLLIFKLIWLRTGRFNVQLEVRSLRLGHAPI